MLRRPRVFLDLCALTLRRLLSQPGLTVMSLAGIVLAVGLVTSAGFFAQAVDRVILGQELAELSRTTGRLPFSTRVYFLPSTRKPMALDSAERAGQSIADTLSAEIGLPIDHLGLQVGSGGMMLTPAPGDARYGSDSKLLGTVNLVYVANVADHLEIVSGERLDHYAPAEEGALDVWMHARMAEEMGIQAGETFRVAVNITQPARLVYVRGLWQAADPGDRFWFTSPDSTMRTSLLVMHDGYESVVQPMVSSKSGFVAWHLILDDGRINPSHAAQYVTGFERGMEIINQYVPGARLDVSPLDPLKDFVLRQTTLTLVLLGFNIPAFGFLLYFLVLVALIVARWQTRETSLLVSRGMSRSGVIGLVLIEETLLFVIGVPLGIAFGMWLARSMGFAQSFLTFTDRSPLPVSLQGVSFSLIAVALAFALLARLVPVFLASRQSVVEQARESARPIRQPFWQRNYLDFLLILPTHYAYTQLVQRGTLATSSSEGSGQLFSDPLLVLVPALFIVTLALLIMRLFPWLMRCFDLIAGRAPWLTLHLALRQLARDSQNYVNPLLLVIVALALGVYTRTLAASLDQWLEDQIFYRVGADISFMPYSEGTNGEFGESEAVGAWVRPIDEYLDLPGVAHATRVGEYPARVMMTDNRGDPATLLAIDRVDFSDVAWFRRDFAPESLGALMNRLAIAPDNVLVDAEFLAERGLRMGDKITLRVGLDDAINYTGLFTIAGVFNYFPTVESDEIAIVGNLEHLVTQRGAIFPHAIWLRLEEGISGEDLFSAVRAKGLEPVREQDALSLLAKEQARMERVGIFGTLSVGFLAAAVMAVMALLIHNYASMRERLYQFGVLRAIGLFRRQMIWQVVLEYALLTAYGALAGAAIGLATAQIFAPFFRIPDEAGAPLPPLIPLIAEKETVQLALAFAAAMIALELVILLRALSARLFDALRMGHQG